MREARLLTKPMPNAENEYKIDIWVPKEHRGEGAGTRLLKQVTDDADNEGVTLYADPEPPSMEYDVKEGEKYEEDRNRLIRLYKKFGFEFERSVGGDEYGRWMIRKPIIKK
jgi:GNAT superfamily N-acetyltransferase